MNPRCRVTDQPEWGADAIFDIEEGQLEFRSYHKLPVPQTSQENCVAHNGSMIPVPGRDIMAQAWYQGGLSLVDFTDSSNPQEIAYFDRGPMNATSLVLGGLWSTYWYNGNIFGTEIARGFDVFGLTPTAQLSANEIAAASQVEMDGFNAQMQPRIEWDPSFAVSRSYFDQLVRADGIATKAAQDLEAKIGKAERFTDSGQESAAAAQLNAAAEQLDSEAKRVDQGKSSGDADGLRGLATSLRELAASRT